MQRSGTILQVNVGQICLLGLCKTNSQVSVYMAIGLLLVFNYGDNLYKLFCI